MCHHSFTVFFLHVNLHVKAQKAYVELNKRITEHDKCQRKGMEQAKVTLQVTLELE